MIATLDAFGVDILFTVGGDGTLRGAQALHEALARAAAARSRWSACRRPSTTTSSG
jgi:6-phosphofructokinase